MLLDKLFSAIRKKKPPKITWTVRIGDWGELIHVPQASYPSRKLQWVSVEQDENGQPQHTRTPQEQVTSFPMAEGFTAAGKHYTKLEELYAEADEKKIWCKDIYGREVLYLAEKFPCFDSYDYATESRFFRWFFLREGGKLTRVYHTDETDEIIVTEDVENLESKQWEEMKRLGYFPPLPGEEQKGKRI